MLDERLPDIISNAGSPARVEQRPFVIRLRLTPELLRLPQGAGGTPRQTLHEHRSDDRDPDHLRPFTGIMVAVGLSAAIWLTITGLLYLLM